MVKVGKQHQTDFFFEKAKNQVKLHQSLYIFIIMPSLFKTQNKESKTHGVGVFALEDIPKGSVWWICGKSTQAVPCLNCSNQDNIAIDQNGFKEFQSKYSQQELKALLHIALYYEDGDQLLILKDGTGVMNHSFEPNSQMIFNSENDYRKLKAIAIKDIKTGDEIVENYGNYTKKNCEWIEHVYKKYIPARLEFEEKYAIQNAKKQSKGQYDDQQLTQIIIFIQIIQQQKSILTRIFNKSYAKGLFKMVANEKKIKQQQQLNKILALFLKLLSFFFAAIVSFLEIFVYFC